MADKVFKSERTVEKAHSKDQYVVLFVRSWAKVSELTDLIYDATGYLSPLIKVNIGGNKKHTEFAFCAVPRWAGDKLVRLNNERAKFEYAKFEKKFESDFRGLYIKVPRENTQHAWMRKAIRRCVLDTVHQLEILGLIKPKSCFLSKNFRLFVNDDDDKVVQILHAFINGLRFYNGDRVYYIKSYFLRKYDATRKSKHEGVKCDETGCYLEIKSDTEHTEHSEPMGELM